MSQYDNEMTGVLFKNDKGDNPKRPDFTGTITIHGVEYRLSSWVNESENVNGGKYHKIKVQKPDEGGAQSAGSTQQAESEDEDDIGF